LEGEAEEKAGQETGKRVNDQAEVTEEPRRKRAKETTKSPIREAPKHSLRESEKLESDEEQTDLEEEHAELEDKDSSQIHQAKEPTRSAGQDYKFANKRLDDRGARPMGYGRNSWINPQAHPHNTAAHHGAGTDSAGRWTAGLDYKDAEPMRYSQNEWISPHGHPFDSAVHPGAAINTMEGEVDFNPGFYHDRYDSPQYYQNGPDNAASHPYNRYTDPDPAPFPGGDYYTAVDDDRGRMY
jgi:hypothetical protein